MQTFIAENTYKTPTVTYSTLLYILQLFDVRGVKHKQIADAAKSTD